MSKYKPTKDVNLPDAMAPVSELPKAAPLVRKSDKTEVMLRPNWPGGFRRTIKVGEESKVLNFAPGEALEVTPEELKALSGDLGKSLFEIERDEKGRPRFIESDVEPAPSDPTRTKPAAKDETGDDGPHV